MFGFISSWFGGSKPSPQIDTKTQNPLNPQGIKPCCACPETKRARDECYMQNSSDTADDKCFERVLAHIECMKSYGFDIEPKQAS